MDACSFPQSGLSLTSWGCRFGSGLDGMSMTEELTQLLALLMEPVGANTWMVDWIWGLYKEALQPFLVLAGPASNGAAIHCFRECWACLPWYRATFHCISPGMPVIFLLASCPPPFRIYLSVLRATGFFIAAYCAASGVELWERDG